MHGISEYKISRVMKFVRYLGENRNRKALRRWNEDYYDPYDEEDDHCFQYNRRTKDASSRDLVKMTQIGKFLLYLYREIL